MTIRRAASFVLFIAVPVFGIAGLLLVGSWFDLSSGFGKLTSSQEPEQTPTVIKIGRYVPPPTSTPTETATRTRKPTATATKSLTPTRKPTWASSPTTAALRSHAVSRAVTATRAAVASPTAAALVSMGQSYALLSSISGHAQLRPADVNLLIRGFVPVNATRALVDYAGEADSAAPQLAGLFADRRAPAIVATYQLYDWNADCDCRGSLMRDYDVTLVGLSTAPGEILSVPDSGYDIGGGHEALVVYADGERMVLTFTSSDSVIRGYALYVEAVAVDGNLVALYQRSRNAGQGQLPALRSAQPFGKARGNELRVAIRDSGAFMDPRSRKDWWRGR